MKSGNDNGDRIARALFGDLVELEHRKGCPVRAGCHDGRCTCAGLEEPRVTGRVYRKPAHLPFDVEAKMMDRVRRRALAHVQRARASRARFVARWIDVMIELSLLTLGLVRAGLTRDEVEAVVGEAFDALEAASHLALAGRPYDVELFVRRAENAVEAARRALGIEQGTSGGLAS